MKVTRFHHVSVNCHDASLDDMTAFYGGLFGLDDVPRPEIPGVPGTWKGVGDLELHLVGAPPRGTPIDSTGNHYCVAVDDLTAAIAELDARASSTSAACRASRTCRSGSTTPPATPSNCNRTRHLCRSATEAAVTFTPYDRPVRAAFVGLGRIYDLNVRAYRDNPDVEVVALVDPSEERRAERARDWPDAQTFASVDELAASGLAVDAVEALLPIPLHVDGVVDLLGHGWHVNLQKPMCNTLPDAQRMLDAATANDRVLRVMENYLFYEPLQKLKATIEDGAIGDVVGYHLKMVASGRGGWDVPMSSYEWQFRQMRDHSRGILVFDDGWHKLATALWLFGPIAEVRAWIGETEVVPGITMDAPTMIAWEHESGVRGVWDITLATDLYLRSDYYTNDERWEVTGRRGYARVNRCTGRGIQQPSLEVYADGELTSYHDLDDDWASSFRDSGRHWLRWLHTGEGPLWWSGEEAVDVLRFALAAYASSAAGGVGVHPGKVE